MSESTGKFLVIGGVRFAQVTDAYSEETGCNRCAFHHGGCTVGWQEEKAQGLDCIADMAHYEVVQ